MLTLRVRDKSHQPALSGNPMRRSFLVLLLVLLAPLAVAHEDVEHGEADVVGFLPPGQDLNHIRSAEVTLAPGESGNYTLSFSGSPFKAGWHWLVRADVEGAVGMDIFLDERFLSRQNFGEGSHVRTETLPFQGKMRLELRNLQEENSTIRFYYDQTCECLYKRVPLQSGPVWFNVPAQEGQQVSWQFTLQPTQTGATDQPAPRNVSITARHLTVDDDPLGGFTAQESTSVVLSMDDPICREPATRWNGCVFFDFTAAADGDQLVWFEVSHDGDPGWTYMIQPLVEVTDPVQNTPLPWGLGLLAIAFAYRRAT